ncbi:MAG: hypothetical protein ACT4NU_01010 [Chromatiales bacterium]
MLVRQADMDPNDTQARRAEGYRERREKILDWDVHIVCYKSGDRYYCKIDDIEPGAVIARAEGDAMEYAEAEALAIAKLHLSRRRRFKV